MHGVTADQLRPFVRIGEHRAAVAIAAERLGGEEARGGDVAERARHLPVDGAAEALRAVLQQQHAVALADLADRRVIRRQPEEVDRHDGPGEEAGLVLHEPYGLFKLDGIEVEGPLVDVHERGRRAEQRRRLPAREEREVGHEHRVARSDAPSHERELQRVGSVGAGYAVPGADVVCEPGFELRNLRAADETARPKNAERSLDDLGLERPVLGFQITKFHAAPHSVPHCLARTSSRKPRMPNLRKGRLRIRMPIHAAAPALPA